MKGALILYLDGVSLKKNRTTERRRYIIDNLRRYGKVSYDDIRKHCDDVVNGASIQTDIDFLRLHGYNVSSEPMDASNNRKALVDHTFKGEDSMYERSHHQRAGKLAIASLAVGFAVGVKDREQSERNVFVDEMHSKLHSPRSMPQILREIDERIADSLKPRKEKSFKSTTVTYSPEAHTRLNCLKRKLEQYWMQNNRSLILDAGTTNLAISEFLSELTIPSPIHDLRSFNVCTNYRQIFYSLGAPGVNVRAMMVGGRQIETGAVAGFEAITFMKSLISTYFGMCILGTSYVNLNPSCFMLMTGTSDEAELKSHFLQMSEIKVVAADWTKFTDLSVRSGQGFASIDQIDLIISNRPPEKKDSSSREFYGADPELFKEGIQAIEARGVPVLLAIES